MNKAELVAAVAAQTMMTDKTISTVLGGLEDVVAANVKKGEKVTLTGFVSFDRVDRKARKGHNPSTGEPIRIKASKGVKITPGAALRKVVNGETPAPKLGKPAVAPARKAVAQTSKPAGVSTRKATAAPTRPAPPRPVPPAPAGSKPPRPASPAKRPVAKAAPGRPAAKG